MGAVTVEGVQSVMSEDKRQIEGQVVERWTSVNLCGSPWRWREDLVRCYRAVSCSTFLSVNS